MNDPTTLILLSLVAGPRHGYAIQQEIERRAAVRLRPGTLYGAISRLEEAGLIVSLQSPGRRRPYRLTTPGRKELATRVQGVRILAAWANATGMG